MRRASVSDCLNDLPQVDTTLFRVPEASQLRAPAPST
ncbi:arsenical resistance protein ArsH, partial [Paraburkholderia sp. SIMBA_050]